jgi:predicted glycoside hydrolase/deacetylase ChbG (UPF0249 family)
MRFFTFALMFMFCSVGVSGEDVLKKKDENQKTKLIIRMDDVGFCHATNVALQKILDEGGVFSSVSCIVNTPWIDEAAEIFRKHPEICVGVHLVLNSEWREFRWGPVLPYNEVPSLVNADGKFFGSRGELFAHEPSVEEMGREIRAQIDLALRKGLNVSYCDYHMGAALSTKEFQEELEKVALEYHIGISRYFEEDDTESVYRFDPPDKLKEGIRILDDLDSSKLNLFVIHPGMKLPEMTAMTDLNVFGPKNMAGHRQAETEMICAPEFKEAIKRNNIEIIDYNDLKAKGLHLMRRPNIKPTLEETIRKAKIKLRETK